LQQKCNAATTNSGTTTLSPCIFPFRLLPPLPTVRHKLTWLCCDFAIQGAGPYGSRTARRAGGIILWLVPTRSKALLHA
jgi:hypothetical protein